MRWVSGEACPCRIVLNEVGVLLHSPELTVSLWPFFLGWDCMTLKSSPTAGLHLRKSSLWVRFVRYIVANIGLNR